MGKLKNTFKKISKMISRLIEFLLKIIRQTIYHLVNFSKRNWKTILIITSIVTGCVLLSLFFWNFETISEIYFTDKNAKGELLKVFLTTIGGVVAIFALYYTAKRIKVMEKGNVETRFNNAVGHFGNANSAVILGGIHALHEIAVENKNYTKIVHNLFCSYLRDNSAKLYEGKDKDYCPVIIQTLIDYLFKPYNNRDSVYKDFKSDLSFCTLTNCDFREVEIKNVIFYKCILENCYFWGGTLTNCNFREGTLTVCEFWHATLTDCYFEGGTLTNCYFEGGTLTKCRFNDVTLTKCYCDNGTLNNCDFLRAKLINCICIEPLNLINTTLPPIEIIPRNC